MTDQERKELERRIAVETHKLNGGDVDVNTENFAGWKEFTGWEFDWVNNNYRIAAPKKRKIKLEAWLNKEYGCIEYRTQPHGFFDDADWTRLPVLDQKVEVEDGS